MTVKRGTKPERIILRFSSGRFPYVVSKPLHPTQKIIIEEDCTIQLTVHPNPELRNLLFSYIPDIEILELQWYREALKNKIEENLKKYLNDEAWLHSNVVTLHSLNK